MAMKSKHLPSSLFMSALLDATEFRAFAGHFATGVAVVTTRDGCGKPNGLTINAVTSLSLDPPLLLICLANDSSTLAAINQSAAFCVHYLAADQQTLSNHFARKLDDKFLESSHSIGGSGCPILEGVVAYCECEVQGSYPGGDHTILVGAVTRTSVTGGDPLIYHRGRYHGLNVQVCA
jgi:flavin reductase (DIM6/NTAB) family NADH-FMN oxidoreductase RutF